MKIGDEFVMRPSIFSRDDGVLGKLLPCRVVYIHPQRRFFTVEFCSEVTGETFRESFPCPDRAEIVREPPQKEAADNKRQFGPASMRVGGIFTKAKG